MKFVNKLLAGQSVFEQDHSRIQDAVNHLDKIVVAKAQKINELTQEINKLKENRSPSHEESLNKKVKQHTALILSFGSAFEFLDRRLCTFRDLKRDFTKIYQAMQETGIPSDKMKEVMDHIINNEEKYESF
jgi:hypothetical protein